MMTGTGTCPISGTNMVSRPFLSGGWRKRLPAFRHMHREKNMTRVVYSIVEHDGGWAYKLADVFSETFPTRDMAIAAATAAAAEQQVGGDDEEISFQDDKGLWHYEHAEGGDRPEAIVDD